MRDPNVFDKEALKSYLSNIPVGYELKRIDREIANMPSLHNVSPDFTSQFDSIDEYLNKGIGFCILNSGNVVCGASSFGLYDEGIEIGIATDNNHRKK